MSLKSLTRLVKEITREKTPEQEFLFLLGETIKRENEPRQPSKSYKPSSLGGCLRRCAFEKTGTPIDVGRSADPDGVGIMESGTDRHERIQKYVATVQKYYPQCEWIDVEEYLKHHPQSGTRVVQKKGMETKLANDVLELSFMCDGIIKLNDVYYVIEIKTEASFKWQGRVKPEDKHEIQASCYAACLGIDRVIFLYEQRDLCKKKPFLYRVTENEKNENVVHRIETCNSYIERGAWPPMTNKQSECRYCPFTQICEKVGVTE